jgi:solute carrier family 8 (sodium/calcium exchanger)
VAIIRKSEKKGTESAVRVRTEDEIAKAEKDYDPVDTIINFKENETLKFVEVKINDDDNWEPDRDFYLKLFNTNDINQQLPGADTKTRITIIDDDKPGYIAFDNSAKAGIMKVTSTEEEAKIKLVRKNGADGKVTVVFETVKIGDGDGYAVAGVDYEVPESTEVVFEDKET